MRDRLDSFDFIVVGGGLQGGLVAAALHARRPGCRLALVERGASLGGNHTWSFHESDLAAASRDWGSPLITQSWPDQEVRFPNLSRRLATGYHTISSERLDRRVRELFAAHPDWRLVLAAEARILDDARVEVGGLGTLSARLVIDARGPGRCTVGAGYQKFVGLEVRLARPSPVTRPIIMDATVAQHDGYRFMYVLPFSSDHVLLEDTYFSDHPELDGARLRERVLAYARERGYAIAEVMREEAGVLPMPWESAEPDPMPRPGLVALGYRGGFYHPATGYSFPIAARMAELVASTPDAALPGALARAARAHAGQRRFAHLLNWLAFVSIKPEARWQVYERVYRRLDEATLGRFYALDLMARDQAAFLLGRPPGGLSARQLWRRLRAAPFVVDGETPISLSDKDAP